MQVSSKVSKQLFFPTFKSQEEKDLTRQTCLYSSKIITGKTQVKIKTEKKFNMLNWVPVHVVHRRQVAPQVVRRHILHVSAHPLQDDGHAEVLEHARRLEVH